MALPCQRQLEPFGSSGVGVGLDERFAPVRAGLWRDSPCCAPRPCFDSHHPAGTERAGFLLDEMKPRTRAPGAHPVGCGCLVPGPGLGLAPNTALVPARPSLCCVAAQRFTSRPEPAAFEVFEWLPLALIGFVAGPNDLVVIWKGKRDVQRLSYNEKMLPFKEPGSNRLISSRVEVSSLLSPGILLSLSKKKSEN